MRGLQAKSCTDWQRKRKKPRNPAPVAAHPAASRPPSSSTPLHKRRSFSPGHFQVCKSLLHARPMLAKLSKPRRPPDFSARRNALYRSHFPASGNISSLPLTTTLTFSAFADPTKVQFLRYGTTIGLHLPSVARTPALAKADNQDDGETDRERADFSKKPY